MTLLEINDIEKTICDYIKNKKQNVNYIIIDNQTLSYHNLKYKVVEINVKDGITGKEYDEALSKLKKE